MAYADGATGAWRIEGDTVILWSPDFSIVLDSVLLPYGPRCWPNLNKYTDATDDNRDRYLVRGNKLYPIMKDGINELPLVKNFKKTSKNRTTRLSILLQCERLIKDCLTNP